MTNDELALAASPVIRGSSFVIIQFTLGGDQREITMLAEARLISLLAAICISALVVETCVADDTLATATRMYQAGDWQAAATAFDQLSQDSQQPEATRHEARLYSGECLTQLGRYVEARQRFQSVHQQATSARVQAQALFRLGEVAWLAGDREAGMQLLRDYVTRYSQGSSVHYAKKYLRQIGQRETLEANFELLDEAVGLERVGRLDEALLAYDRILSTHHQQNQVRAETLRRSALLHERLAQPREAIQLFQTYLTAAPHSQRSAEVMQAIAWNHVRLDQTTQASEQFQAVLSKFPQSPQAAEAAYWLAQKLAEVSNTEQSLSLLRSVFERKDLADERPELFGQALCLQCQLHSSQGQWKAVETHVETHIELITDATQRAKLEYWSAEAAFRQRQYNTARKRFNKLQPRTIGVEQSWTAMVPLRRAQLAARRQQWREVLSILDQMERDFPEFELNYEVDYLRGRALAGLGNMTAARKFYRAVISNSEPNETEAAVMAGWMIGETYFHQRDYARARHAYQLVMEKQSFPEWQSRAALQAGKCWELEQHWTEAAEVYETALERWPQSISEQQLKSRLRWAQTQSTSGISTQ